MPKLWSVLLSLGSIVWLVRNLFANRGFIPFASHVKIYEPQQRALIAWNGKQEILILSTNIHASESTQVLEVLPAPSEPAVKEGDLQVFERVIKLIVGHEGRGRGMVGGGVSDFAQSAGEVTFHERIGVHDISVTRVLQRDGFMKWVEGYLSSAGVEKPQVSEEMSEIVEQYINEGFGWFVFDVVSVVQDIRVSNPIHYKFSTPRLYYPLRITRLGEGATSIQLFVLTNQPLVEFTGFPRELIRSPLPGNGAMKVTQQEIEALSRDLAELFEKQGGAVQLWVWEIEESLDTFHEDLVIRSFFSRPAAA